MNNAENKKSVNKSLAVLAVMIVLQVAVVFFAFAFEKEDGHSDEIWSFGLANSYYNPHLFFDDITRDQSRRSQWRDGQELHDYITVQKGERFTYDSVWSNQVNDMSPPLYYAMLHTICSLFPDTYSRWYAFPINLLSMVLGQIFLFKAGKKIFKSDYLALILCFFWGFSMGFFNVHTFMRMYSPTTLFAIMFLYYNAKIYYDEVYSRSDLIKLCVSVILGALFNHFFLICAFGMTAVFCFYYLFSKRIKKLLLYALSVAGGVGLSILIFPSTISHLFVTNGIDERNSLAMPFVSSLRMAVTIVLNSIMGVPVSAFATGNYIYFVTALVVLVCIGVPLCFLFRKEEWFISFRTKAVSALKYFFTHLDILLISLIISVALVCIVCAFTVNINNMKLNTDRYLFVCMPLAATAVMLIIKYLIGPSKRLTAKSNIIVTVLCLIFVISGRIMCTPHYIFYKDTEGQSIQSTVTENTSYFLALSDGWRLTMYPPLIMGCDEYCFSSTIQYEDATPAITQRNKANECYVIVETTLFNMRDDMDKLGEQDVTEVAGGIIKVNKTEDNMAEDILSEEEYIEYVEQYLPGCRLQFCGSEKIFGTTAHTYKVVSEADYVDVPVPEI